MVRSTLFSSRRVGLVVGLVALALVPAQAGVNQVSHRYWEGTMTATAAGLPQGKVYIYARTYDGVLLKDTGFATLIEPSDRDNTESWFTKCKANPNVAGTLQFDCGGWLSNAATCSDSFTKRGVKYLVPRDIQTGFALPTGRINEWTPKVPADKTNSMTQYIAKPIVAHKPVDPKTFVVAFGPKATVPGTGISGFVPTGLNSGCADLTEATPSPAIQARLWAVYNTGAFEAAVVDPKVAATPCVPFDFGAAFPAWVNEDTGLPQLGFPFAKANLDALLCPDDWWHVYEFQIVRYIGWIILFFVAIVAFFAFSCVIMPRLNGRKDTTGICGKWGNVISDKLDKNPKLVAMKRKRDDNWNGMLFIVFKHFNKSGSGSLSAEEYYEMFSICGDGFIDKDMFVVAATTFGNCAEGSEEALLDIEALEAIYSAGNQSWRAKHSQCKRDLERVKILSDDYPDYTHSDYLVITSSIGSAGMSQYEMKKMDLDGEEPKKRLSMSTKKKELEAEAAAKKMRRASSLARAGPVELAAKGGSEYAKSYDTEFDIESAMTEEERFSVPLPSLYIETWLFTLICAFLFLFLFDLTRFIDTASLRDFRAEHCTCKDLDRPDYNCENNFVSAKYKVKCLDELPPGFFPPPAHPLFVVLWINGKVNVIADIGHKVCIFHFLFILLFVMPSRLFTILKPDSCCAKQMRERLKPPPLNAREFRPLKENEKPTVNLVVTEDNPPGKEVDVKYGKLSLGQSVKFTIPADARMGACLRVEIPEGPDFQGVPVDCLITASVMTPCDKIKMLPLILLRNFMGVFVAIFNMFGVSLALFVFFDPLITFQQQSLHLAHVRVSGCSFAFAADPIDAYMRWLNLKIIDMLTLGCFEKKCAKKAAKMYLGFLDDQITWNVALGNIPKGLDTTRSTFFFQAVVPPIETLIQGIMQAPMMALTPVWPAFFAKHISVGQQKLWLSKLRFGGRQPRLGGSFVGPGNCKFNKEGCMRVSKINGITLCMHVSPGPCQKKFDLLLEENIEWVVPPPSGRKCAYVICPFPCDGSDEDPLSIDEPIPVIIDDTSAFEFPLQKKCDANALTAEEVAFTLNGWAKKDKTGERMKAIDANAEEITPEIAESIIKKLTLVDGVSKSTMNARELKAAIEAYLLISSDVRCSSPIFKRTRKSSVSVLFDGYEKQISSRGSVTVQANPMGGKKKAKDDAAKTAKAEAASAAVTATAAAAAAEGASAAEAAKKAAAAKAAPVRPDQPGERRLADGELFTKQEFKDHYGGYKEWLAAENDPHEQRTDAEGGTYTKQEFVDHYGGTTEWDSGKILDTAF